MLSRVVRFHEFGGADVLRIEQADVGEPKQDEVLLRVAAIGLNRTEVTLRSGRSPAKPKLPSHIGFEAAGTIEKIGAGVLGFAPGDRVALVPTYGAAQYGLYAEYSLAPAASLVAIPEEVDFVTAAATWVALGTAWGGLAAIGMLKPGETVLISAASSSVGLAAIQVARRIGAVPLALTSSPAKSAAIAHVGADAVIDRAGGDFAEEISGRTLGKGVDMVFDPVGGPGFAELLHALAPGGRAVLYGALDQRPTEIRPFDVFGRDLTVKGLALTSLARNPGRLREMKAFVSLGLEEGALAPVIARTFTLDEIVDAHRFLEAGEHVGKIVVTV